jgi:hypothetical protein
MQVNTAFALAFVDATVKDINQRGSKASWVSRAVVDRVIHTKLGTKTVPSTVVHGSKGVMVRK